MPHLRDVDPAQLHTHSAVLLFKGLDMLTEDTHSCIIMYVGLSLCYNKAKSVVDTLKTQGKYVHKILQSHVELCEVANNVHVHHESLNRRDLRTSINELMKKDVVIPRNIRLAVSRRCVGWMCQDLADTIASKKSADVEAKRDKCFEKLCSTLAVWRYSEQSDGSKFSTNWEFDNPSFAALAAEIKDEMETSLDDPAQTEARNVQLNEAERSVRVCALSSWTAFLCCRQSCILSYSYSVARSLPRPSRTASAMISS